MPPAREGGEGVVYFTSEKFHSKGIRNPPDERGSSELRGKATSWP